MDSYNLVLISLNSSYQNVLIKILSQSDAIYQGHHVACKPDRETLGQ